MLAFISMLLIYSVKSQVSPTWMQSPYVETNDFVLVNDNSGASSSFTVNSTYQKTLNNIQVSLAITGIRVVSDTSMGFRCTLTNPGNAAIRTHVVQIFSPTVVWYLKLRYFAYDGNYAPLSHVHIGFLNNSGLSSRVNNVYTQTRPVTAITSAAVGDYYLSAFLTGFQATSADFYFANLTYTMTSTSQIQLKATVAATTTLNSITVYFLLADKIKLREQSWVFVETAVTQSSFGSQYSYFTPTRFFDDNYISGLKSFSIYKNLAFNFTVSNVTFSTSSSSKYDDVMHFNLWVRFCNSPYTYFNPVDLLCYRYCPDGTYLISANLLCETCHYSCSTCTTASTCDTCAANRVENGSMLCQCMPYYFEFSQVCVACHYSCETCVYSEYMNCDSCDISMKRIIGVAGSNTTCDCDTGYRDVGKTRCSQICGDGVLYEDECDDGNNLNDDGCSSTCKVEKYFYCTSNVSSCFFNGNITLTVARTVKDPHSNTVSFYLKLAPFVPLMSGLKLDNLETNITNFNEEMAYLEGEYLVYKGSYVDTLEDSNVRISLIPSTNSSDPFSQFMPTSCHFVAKSDNGLPLTAYTTTVYNSAAQLELASYIIGFIFLLFAFIFSYGGWKELGSELFMTTQFSFLSYVSLNYFTPYTVGSVKVKYIMGYNDAFGQQAPPYLQVPTMEHMGYSVAFQYNFNIMAIVCAVVLIMYLIQKIVRRYYLVHKEQDEQEYQASTLGKVMGVFSFQLFAYFIFFCMQQILVGTVLQTEYVENGGIFVYIVLFLVAIIICVIGLIVRPKSFESYRKLLFHASYGSYTFIIVLFSIVLMDVLLILSVTVSFKVYYCLPLLPLIVIAYVAIRRPFKHHWNNIRLILVELCVLCAIILQIITFNKDEATTFLFPIGILVCIVLPLLITIVVWIIMIVKSCTKKEDDESSKYQSAKEEESINEKVREAAYEMHSKPSSRIPIIREMDQINTSRNRSRTNRSNIRSNARSNARPNVRSRQVDEHQDYNQDEDLHEQSKATLKPMKSKRSKMMKSPNTEMEEPTETLKSNRMLKSGSGNRENAYRDILDSTLKSKIK